MSETLARLRALDCCAVSDAMDRLGLSGAVTGLRQESGAAGIAGRAITVKLGTGPASGGPPKHLCTSAVESAGPDNIIVIEQRTSVDAGSWGGLLTRGAVVRGIAGVVADGPVRDIDEARELGFAIFANRMTCLTARGRIVELANQEPIQVGAVMVEAGDFTIADNSGVVFIKPNDIDRVLAAAEEIVEREAAMARLIEAGKPISSVLGGDYEDMLKEE